jgi:hypothetical protein
MKPISFHNDLQAFHGERWKGAAAMIVLGFREPRPLGDARQDHRI